MADKLEYRKGKVREIIWNVTVNSLLASYIVPSRMRVFFLRMLGVKFMKKDGRRENYLWEKSVIFSNKLELGYNANINRFCLIDNRHAKVTIGEDSALSYNVTILTSGHEKGTALRRYGSFRPEEVSIGNGVWIGANATILPGVTIGDGCIIAAGAVVTSDCSPNCMYGGVPARLIRELE